MPSSIDLPELERDNPLASIVDRLETAHRTHTLATPASMTAGASLTMSDAYRISVELSRRLVRSGDPIIGVKLGLTNAGAQAEFNVGGPVFAFLHQSGFVPAQAMIAQVSPDNPAAEPELAAHVTGPVDETVADSRLVDRVQVSAAIELDQSRTSRDNVVLEDIVADRCWAGRFMWAHKRIMLSVLGDQPLDLIWGGADTFTTVRLASPVSAVVDRVRAASQWARSWGVVFDGEWTVMCGGEAPPRPLGAATLTAHFPGLGLVRMRADR